MRPRIGVVAAEFGGGVGTVVEFVCEAIERSGRFDLALVLLPCAARDRLGVALTRPSSWARGVRTLEGVWRNRRFTSVGAVASELEFQRYRPRPALSRALEGCDVVQVVAGFPAPAHAVCGLGTPVAVLCATRARVDRESRHRARRGPAERWRRAMTTVIDRFDRQALRRADVIQVMNPWMLRYAQEVNAGLDKPIRLLQPGIDVSRFVPSPERRWQSTPYVLSVGRFGDDRKNISLLLDAFAALAARVNTPVRLVLAGAEAPGGAFWRRVVRLGLRARVSFIDSPDRDALIALYQRSAVFALASDEEGFGMVLLEAMACGTPVVSTSCGGPDAIVRDGVEGYLVPVRDPVALANRLERLVRNHALNHDMGAAARRAAVARFDAHRAGQALLDMYDDLAGEAPLRREA